VTCPRLHPASRSLQHQLIPGNHRPAELDTLEAQQNRHFARVFELLRQQQTAELSHRLDDQHTRHDRLARVVAGEKFLVGGDVLDPNGMFAGLHLHHPVNHQEGIAVRQQSLDLADVKNRLGPQLLLRIGRLLQLSQLADQFMVQGVARFAGEDIPGDEPPEQEQVAQQIQDLVPNALVRKPERILDRAFLAEDKNVIVGQVRPQARRPELLRLLFEDEGTGTGNMLLEILGGQANLEDLLADRPAAVIEVVDDFDRVLAFAGRSGHDVVRSFGHANRLGDPEHLARTVLGDDAGLFELLDKRNTTSVKGRDFVGVQLHKHVVDAQPRQSRHAMLDGLDLHGPVPNGGPPEAFGDVLNNGRNSDWRLLIGPHEHHAGVGVGRAEAHDRLLAGEEPPAGQFNGIADGLLRLQVARPA